MRPRRSSRRSTVRPCKRPLPLLPSTPVFSPRWSRERSTRSRTATAPQAVSVALSIHSHGWTGYTGCIFCHYLILFILCINVNSVRDTQGLLASVQCCAGFRRGRVWPSPACCSRAVPGRFHWTGSGELRKWGKPGCLGWLRRAFPPPLHTATGL